MSAWSVRIEDAQEILLAWEKRGPEALELIRWFLQALESERLPAEPFPLRQHITVVNPALKYRVLLNDLRLGPAVPNHTCKRKVLSYLKAIRSFAETGCTSALPPRGR